MKRFLLRFILGMILLTAALEIFFHTVVPASRPPKPAQDSEFRVLIYDADARPTGLFTCGRLAQLRIPWRINNYGWNSGIDFKAPAERDRPCIVITGDSYVEGFFSRQEDHLDMDLARRLDGSHEVYGLGMSGQNLAQVIPVARYAAHNFSPEIVLVVVTANDLLQSLPGRGGSGYNLTFAGAADSLVAQGPNRLRPGKRRPIKNSAIMRYIAFNANHRLGRARPAAQPAPAPAPTPPMPIIEEGIGLEAAKSDLMIETGDTNKTTGTVETTGETDLLRAVLREILRTLREEHPTTRFLFVADADREAIYADPSAPGETLLVTRLLAEQVDGRSMALLDLSEAFRAEFLATGRRLNFDFNYHWNPLAERIAVTEIHRELTRLGWVATEVERTR